MQLRLFDEAGESPGLRFERLRREVIRRDNWQCTLCRCPENLEVHHNTYERYGHEEPEDLTTLCHSCHLTYHKNRWLDPVLLAKLAALGVWVDPLRFKWTAREVFRLYALLAHLPAPPACRDGGRDAPPAREAA